MLIHLFKIQERNTSSQYPMCFLVRNNRLVALSVHVLVASVLFLTLLVTDCFSIQSTTITSTDSFCIQSRTLTFLSVWKRKTNSMDRCGTTSPSVVMKAMTTESESDSGAEILRTNLKDPILKLSGGNQEWNANQYQEQCGFVWKFGAESLLDLAKIKKGERILDIGCGSGELTELLYQKSDTTCIVIGIDSSSTMIEKALHQYKEKYPNLQFIQKDVLELTFPFQYDRKGEQEQNDEEFDLLFSNAALHWIPANDIEQAIQRMVQHLKIGGRFVCEFGGKYNIHTIVSACYDAQQKLIDIVKNNDSNNHQDNITINPPIDTIPWYFPSISEFTVLLEKYGIEVSIAELYDRPTVLTDGINGLRNWITMFGEQKLIPSIVVSSNTTSTTDESTTGSNEKQKQVLLDMFFDIVNDICKPTLYSTADQQWVADYRRIRIVGKKINNFYRENI